MSETSFNGSSRGAPEDGASATGGVHTSGEPRLKPLEVIQRITLFVLIAVVGQTLLPSLLLPLGSILVVSTVSVFAAGVIANEISVRVWETGKIADFGMGWTQRSLRELLTGLACGAGAVAAIILLALALRFAVYEDVPAETNWPSLVFVALLLICGAAGEEMLIHGYGFQVLRRSVGDFAAILPVGVLFGVLHAGNQNVTALAILNTVAWGILLGWAFVLTNALWLPIGLHLGWNLGLMVSGINLSGFTIGVVGYEMHWSKGDLWSGGAYGLEGSLLTTIGVVALFFVLWRVNRDRDKVTGAE